MPEDTNQAPLPAAPPPFEATPALEAFLEKHFKTVLIGLGGLVVLALIYVGFRSAQARKTEEAGAAFVAAKGVEDYDRVIEKYSGSDAAGNSLLAKADLLWEENKKDSSIATLRTFVEKHSKHSLFPVALLGLGAKLDAIGERNEAKTHFQRVVNEFPDSAAAPMAQVRLGDILWAEGKEDEAKQTYEALPAKFPEATPRLLDLSEDRLTWMAAKLPTKEVEAPAKPKEEPKAADGAPSLTPTIDPAGAAPMIKLNSGSTSLPGSAPVLNLTPGGAPMPAAPPATIPPAAPKAAEAPAPAAAPKAQEGPEVPKSISAPAPTPAAPPAPEAPAAPKAAEPPAPAAAPKAQEGPEAPKSVSVPAPTPAAPPVPETPAVPKAAETPSAEPAPATESSAPSPKAP